MSVDDRLRELLARRVERQDPQLVDGAAVRLWCATFDEEEPSFGGGVPTVAYPTFLRPSQPPTGGGPAPTGVVLHDELKTLLDLPVAIAVGYRLELRGHVYLGDRLISVERIAQLGEERKTNLGRGRSWIIEVATSSLAGRPIGVEQFRMLGYRPGEARVARSGVGRESVVPSEFDWTEEMEIDRELIVRMAAANHVWAPAHHRSDAARAAGLPDIILDTSSQVALFAGAAQRRRGDWPIAAVDLAMKRPILPGTILSIAGNDRGGSSTVSAMVDGVEVSRAVIDFIP